MHFLTFSEYLKQLPPDVVFEHLSGDLGSTRRILSAGLVREILETFTQPEKLRERFGSLSPDARMLCSLAYLAQEQGIAIQDGPVARELFSSFLVYRAHDEEGNSFCVGFTDFSEKLGDSVADVLSALAVDPGPVVSGSAWRYRAISDFTVLCILGEQGELRCTQAGNLNRTSARSVHSVLQANTGTPEVVSQERDLEVIVDTLLSYGRLKGILFRDAGRYNVERSEFASWLRMSAADQRSDFIRAIRKTGIGRRAGIMSTLETRLGENRWIPLSVYPSEAIGEAITATIIGRYLEFLDVARDGENVCWRPSPARVQHRSQNQADTKYITVLPDFSAILPRETPAWVLPAFARVGRLVSYDSIYKGEISRETVHNSSARGVDGEAIISLLQERDAPENVVMSVREWIREFERLFLSHRATIISSDERTTRQLESIESLESMLISYPAHRAFMVKPGREVEVERILKEAGFDPRPSKVSSAAGLNSTHAGERKEPLNRTPVFEPARISQTDDNDSRAQSGKYGGGLKRLDMTDTRHVIEYAVLMGQRIRLEYTGSPGLPKGEYEIVPREITHGAIPAVEEIPEVNRERRKFLLDNIDRIGVVST